MKPNEIKNMTIAEIENKLVSLREQLFKLRTELTSGRIERPSRFRFLRHDIARCCTILKEKKSEGQ
ncbi:MAG: 50S ribosomal protein L29 [Candidatus Omnitrophota bacterium]|nr:50S ribosomal protein L29 [Candidatus Omnitrophota bacterium]